MPWQTINRIPWTQTMCRKAPFVRLIQRIAPFHPELFDFLPTSFVLPNEFMLFNRALLKKDKVYIYKPDKGSLGHGIRVIHPGEAFTYNARLAVAQEYIESFTVDNKKFDLRVYALITSLSPLTIYIYRGGVARFCSETVDGDSKFSTITNTAINSKNPNCVPDSMTRMITDLFARLKSEGVDTDKLWSDIDKTIVLTLISAYAFLKKEESIQCPNYYGMSRCFQIIGCDILLDKNLHPYVLEINYRPSLKCNTEHSHDMKLAMLKDALKIGAPLQPLQRLLNHTDYPKDVEGFTSFMQQHKDVLEEIELLRTQNEHGNGFVKVFPNPKNPQWNAVLETAKKLPPETTLESGMPTAIEAPILRHKCESHYALPKKSVSLKELSRLNADAQ